MSKSRWRWATRDARKETRHKNATRYLWSVQPVKSRRYRAWLLPLRFRKWGGGKRYQLVSQAYFRKLFGRDLRPGEKRRLP